MPMPSLPSRLALPGLLAAMGALAVSLAGVALAAPPIRLIEKERWKCLLA